MKVKIPSKRIREEFVLTCKLKGYQRGIDMLSAHYNVRKMKVVLDGRRVGNGDDACYFENKAYFTKRGLTRRNVLHEFYHHLVDTECLELPDAKKRRKLTIM